MEETIEQLQTMPGLKSWEAPGTLRGKEIERAEAQQGFGENFSDAASDTALATGLNLAEQEGPGLMSEITGEDYTEKSIYGVTNAPARILAGVAALTGFRAGEADYKKSERYEELTKGIPYAYHDEIMSNDNLDAALRSRGRIMDQLDRGRRMGMQEGVSSTVALMAGSLVDVDLPLTFMTGGGFGAARIARAGVRTSARMGLSEGMARMATSTAIGASAGLQAGALVGAAEWAWKDTGDWTMFASAALTGAAMGGGINGAVRGDLGLQIKAAQDEFLARVARDDPTLRGEGLDVETLRPQPVLRVDEDAVDDAVDTAEEAANKPAGPAVRYDDEGSDISTAGAQNLSSQGVQRLDRTKYKVEPRIEQVTTISENWVHDSGWKQRKKEAEDEWLYNFATKGIGGIASQDYNKILRSESPTANFLAGAVFESPHGYGRGFATAAIETEHYNKQIINPFLDIEDVLVASAKQKNKTWMNTGQFVDETYRREFYRELMLEVNARRQGRTYSQDPNIHQAADLARVGADTANRIATKSGVRGFDKIPEQDYLPQRWDARRIMDLIRTGKVREDDFTASIANSYVAAGIPSQDLADKLAKAMLLRMKTNADELPTSLIDLIHGDGREWLEGAMRHAGLGTQDIKGIIDRITGTKEEAGTISHAKHRNDIDYEGVIPTTDGSMLQVVDLLDTDLNASWHRYARGMAGASALAKVGIKDKAGRESVITAIREEQLALGEELIDSDLLRAMFTNFDSGPVHGFSKLGGTTKGVSHGVSLARGLTSLSLLGKLGMAQLAETGATASAIGLHTFVQRGVMRRLDDIGRAENRQLLEDLSFITGKIGEDHRYFAPHLQLDSMTAKEAGEYAGLAQKWMGKAQYLHGFTSLFNQIRSWQQTTVAMGMTDKVIRNIAFDMTDNTRTRIELDFGLDQSHMDHITSMIQNGTIEFGNHKGVPYVNRLNLDQWDQEVAEAFAAGITRSINQQVQKSMAGEADSWLNGNVTSMLMQFKTFPLQAISKQALRQARFMDRESYAALLYGMITAYAALSIRDYVSGSDRSSMERAKAAFGYSNLTGFIPTVFDPAMSVLGLEGARINAYGPHSEALTPPAIDVFNRLQRVPGALADYAEGTANNYDRQAVLAIPFMNTYIISNLWDIDKETKGIGQ